MSDLSGNTIKSAKYIYDDDGTTKTYIELTLTESDNKKQIIEVDNASEHYRELMAMVADGSLTIAEAE